MSLGRWFLKRKIRLYFVEPPWFLRAHGGEKTNRIYVNYTYTYIYMCIYIYTHLIHISLGV